MLPLAVISPDTVCTVSYAPANTYSQKEDTYAVYGQINLDLDVLGLPVDGNIGARYLRTSLSTVGVIQRPNGSTSPIDQDASYNNFLPSVNLRTDLAKNVVLRGAASRTMARPDFGALGALSLNDLTMSGSGGNPNLKPIMSNNVDAGVEWYFMPKSLIAVNLYQMKLGSYVTYGSSVTKFYNATLGRVTDYNMSAAINTKARVRGVELQYTQDLSNGFGFSANYTYADGKETQAAPKSACADEGNCDMVGTSKNSYNLSGFFENAKWSARLNYSFRSAFLNGLDRKSAIYQDDVGTVSASINYNINEFLTLSLEGKDLNDPLLKSYASTKDQPRAFYKNGRQVFFGLRGKM